MPRTLSINERNDVPTVTFNDSLNLAGAYTVLGVARAGTSMSGAGTWFTGTYGALLVNANGSFSYRLDNEDPDTNVLAAGQQADDRFTVTYSLGGVTHTDTVTIKVTGIDEPGQQVTTGSSTLQLQGDVTIDVLQQINITAIHAMVWSVNAGETATFVNHGMVRVEAPAANTGTVLSAEAANSSDSYGTLINYGLFEAHGGVGSYGANGPGGVQQVTFINYGVVRAISEGVNQIPFSSAGGGGARHLINYGTIEAISNVEAYAAGGMLIDNFGYIYTSAAVHIQHASIVGVTLGGAGSQLNNSGTIHSVSTSASAQSFGVTMFRDSTNLYAYAKVVNTGTIVADVAVFGYGTSVGGITGMYVVNSGHVEGEYRQDLGLNTLDNLAGGSWVGNVNCGYNEDIVRNAGLIQGAIALDDGSDLYNGQAGTQTGPVSGGAGLDVLLGGSGVDQLSGGDGADRLQGGGGVDSLLGGAGADIFVYAASTDSTAAAVETLTDFQTGLDRIDLSLLAPGAVNLSVSGGVTTITATSAGGTLTLRVNGAVSMADIISAPKAAVTDGTDSTDLLFSDAVGSTLNGLGGDDVLDGGAGNDVLDGGTGVDLLRGGKGDDIYYLDDFGDHVLELDGEGTDELRTFASARMNGFVENLTMLGSADIFASGNRLDNIIIGNAGRNEIFADSGDDILIGGGGRDSMGGGEGRDIFRYLAVGDSVIGAADSIYVLTGEDRIDLRAVTPISVTWQETQYGYWQNYAISNVLTVQTAAGTMTINVSGKLFLSDFVLGNEMLGSTAGEAMNGTGNADTILGGAGDDQLFGLGGSDVLSGEAGNDRLDGGAGADIMTGGAGDDFYVVDDAGDIAWEASPAGRDTVSASVSYTLSPINSIEVLQTTDAAGTAALNLTGNTQDNLIIGNAGDNIIDGGINTDTTNFTYAGTDTLRGLGGNDTYYVDSYDDIVIELADQGEDKVYARYTYVLTAGSSVEKLAADDRSSDIPFNLTGNEFDQVISGNRGANILDGKGGADTFRYLAVAESTATAMDRIRAFQSGLDRIDLVALAPSQISWVQQTDTSDNSLYNLVTAITASGNLVLRVDGALSLSDFLISIAPPLNLVGTPAGGDLLVGDAGNDTLDGRGGADVMRGLGGNDTYIVDDFFDQVIEASGEGNDAVYAEVSYQLASGQSVETLAARNNASTAAMDLFGNAFANTIFGSNGANFLDGAGGADILTGFGGNDIYAVDNAGDVVIEDNGQGNDAIYTTFSYILGFGSSVETLASRDNSLTVAMDLFGNELANVIFGNNGANFLDGLTGADIMTGFGGNDIYAVDNAGDVVIEENGQGNDAIYTTFSYILGFGSSVELLASRDNSLTVAMNLFGNELNNTILGNNGANYLDGLTGADVMAGYSGDDTYIVDNAGDVVVEEAGRGSDAVYTSLSFVLSAGSSVETIGARDNSLIVALNITGNELANGLLGNNGANVLDGKGGADTLLGFAGADTFAFTTAIGTGTGNVDLIADFVSGTDKVALDDAIFTGLAPGALAAGAFVTGTAAADADDRIVYDAATGRLYFDADGNGAGAAILFATLQGNPTLAASDFMVI